MARLCAYCLPAADIWHCRLGSSSLSILQPMAGCVAAAGNCALEVKALCEDVEPGELRVLDCLTQVMHGEDSLGETENAGMLVMHRPERLYEFLSARLNVYTAAVGFDPRLQPQP